MVFRPSLGRVGFRIADRRHRVFDGTGSFLNGSRWNSPGKRVIYAAETYSGALLEMLVHSNLGYVPRTQAWIQINIPEDVLIESVRTDDVPGWDEPDLRASRAYGDRWCAESRTPILVVPSVVTAGVEHNVLINQDHPGFSRIMATEPRDVAWDQRLFRRT